MTGLASLNRYFFWEPRPQPGELEYLAGAVLRHRMVIRGSLKGYGGYATGPQPWLTHPNCDARHSRN